MDSLVIGVLFAGIKYYNNQLYEKFFEKCRMRTLIITVILLLLFIPSYLINRDTSFYARTFMFSIVSFIFIFILFVCLSEMYEFRLSEKIKKIVTFISLTSYSVYLIHLELLTFISNKFPTKNIFETTILAIFLKIRNKTTE